MSTLGSDVVNQALTKAGILGQGRTATAEDMKDGLSDLNDMVAEWNTQRWMVFNLVSLSFISDGRVTPYTIGPGGDFNLSRRPDRIESSFIRQLVSAGLNVDTPLTVIPSLEEYSRLSVKSLKSFSLYVFLDSSWPLGNLYVYPWPNSTIYELWIQMKNVLPVFDQNTDLTVIPDHYISAMKFNLARRLRQGYGKGMTPDIELNNFARNSLNVVKNSNIQIPELVMPRTLVMNSTSYNIYSDQWGGSGG